MFELDYQKVSGSTTYKGSRLGSGDPYGSYVSTTQNELKDVRIMFKERYELSSLVTLQAGVGYGNHSWERELSKIQTETYTWDYLRIVAGGSFKFDAASKLAFDVFAAYEHAFSSTMSADVNGSALDFDLGGVTSYEADFYGFFKIDEDLYLAGGYIIKQQRIESSNIVSGFYEPQSRDVQQFYKLGIIYHF